MGRELKRVPLDFDHPLGEIWTGYLSPDWRPCPGPGCVRGDTATFTWVRNIVQLLMMLPDEVNPPPHRRGVLHPWLAALPITTSGLPRPGQDITELTTGLAGRSPRTGTGHDAGDALAAVRRIGQAAGMPDGWGRCTVCGGEGIHPDDQAAADAWEPTDPPAGDGYQLWETTTEGSPQTPVFVTLYGLCVYAAAHCTVFAGMTATAAEWRRMLDDGLVHADYQADDGTRITFF